MEWHFERLTRDRRWAIEKIISAAGQESDENSPIVVIYSRCRITFEQVRASSQQLPKTTDVWWEYQACCCWSSAARTSMCRGTQRAQPSLHSHTNTQTCAWHRIRSERRDGSWRRPDMKGGKKSAETEIEMDCGTTREQLSVSPCAPGAVADPVKGGLTPPPSSATAHRHWGITGMRLEAPTTAC